MKTKYTGELDTNDEDKLSQETGSTQTKYTREAGMLRTPWWGRQKREPHEGRRDLKWGEYHKLLKNIKQYKLWKQGKHKLRCWNSHVTCSSFLPHSAFRTQSITEMELRLIMFHRDWLHKGTPIQSITLLWIHDTSSLKLINYKRRIHSRKDHDQWPQQRADDIKVFNHKSFNHVSYTEAVCFFFLS